MPELPLFRFVGGVTHSRKRQRFTATVASVTATGQLDVLVTIEAVGMEDARQVAEAIVALSREGGERPAGGDKHE